MNEVVVAPNEPMNLASILMSSAEKFPDRTAIKMDDVQLSYADLDQLSQKLAGLLAAKGVGRGDRIALICPNLPYMPVVFYGALRAGAIVVPMNPLLKSREVAFHLENSGASIAFAWEGVVGEVQTGAARAADESGRAPVEVVPLDRNFMTLLDATEALPVMADTRAGDTAVVLYTSGTTGKPKGAELTHDNLLSNCDVSVGMFKINENDVIFGGLPLFHIFGLTCGLNAAIRTGASLTLLPRFDPAKALEIIERDKVTIFMGVPTMHIGILRCPNLASTNVSTIRHGVSGGSALPLEVLREFETRIQATLLEGYGLSETSPAVSFNQLDGVRKAGSVGQACPGADLAIFDENDVELATGKVGELVVGGRYVMKGYWRNPEATALAIRNGWFHTGDMARRDADGVYFIVDRKKDMILRGGYNVYPREVEEVLYEHPAVAEAAVIGRPDELHGEEIYAVVGIKPEADGDREALAIEIKEFAKERLAAYKYPRHVLIIDALPKGPTGKILKREIQV